MLVHVWEYFIELVVIEGGFLFFIVSPRALLGVKNNLNMSKACEELRTSDAWW